MPREIGRETTARESLEAELATDRLDERSIVVIGDDPLMVRALDRLLRKAGYVVGIRERDLDAAESTLPLEEAGVAALTIIDVPDAWTRRGRASVGETAARRERTDPILWLSNAPSIVDAPERCLVKPFTASQFLAKVEALLSQSSTSDQARSPERDRREI